MADRITVKACALRRSLTENDYKFSRYLNVSYENTVADSDPLSRWSTIIILFVSPECVRALMSDDVRVRTLTCDNVTCDTNCATIGIRKHGLHIFFCLINRTAGPYTCHFSASPPSRPNATQKRLDHSRLKTVHIHRTQVRCNSSKVNPV